MSVDMEGSSGGEEFTFADIGSPFEDSGSSEPSGGESASPTNTQGDNPAWESMLDGLPDSFQTMLKPRLAEWDSNLQKKFQENSDFRKRYEPYQQIVESGINPQIVGASLQLAQQLQNDPVALYEGLRNQLLAQGRIQEAEQVQDHIDDLEDGDDEEDYEDPYANQLDELRNQQESMREYLENQQAQQVYQQEFNRATQEINQGFQEIESKVGRPLSQELKQRTVREAQFLSQQQGRPVSIAEAFQSVTQFVASTRRQAPRILPGNGGGHVQPSAKKVEDMNQGERKDLFAQILQQG